MIQHPEQCDDGNMIILMAVLIAVGWCFCTHGCSLGGTIQPQATEGEVPVDRSFETNGFGDAIARTQTFLFVGHPREGSGTVTVTEIRLMGLGFQVSSIKSGLGFSMNLRGFGASVSASERYNYWLTK